MEPTKVGIIGCGNISSIYFKSNSTFQNINIVACADLDIEKAKAAAKKSEEEGWGTPTPMSVDEILKSDVEIIINLTIPAAHHSVDMQALNAGKHVHGEKPLCNTREEGAEVLATAKAKGLRVGAAPDTFMGAGIQTCRKYIDDGMIGRPVAGTAFMLCPGHERWHPAPDFYYKAGGGPMFDMGPYYITALVNLLGPIRRICGATGMAQKERIITSQPKYGQVITVDVPTHVAGVMEFENGAIVTIITSFDVVSHHMPCIELYGTEGSIQVPDPNGFGGNVSIMRREKGNTEWRVMPYTHIYEENSRGIGVADMAQAIQSGRGHRASGELAYHVLEAMHGFHDAASSGAYYTMKSRVERPAAMPVGLLPGTIDA